MEIPQKIIILHIFVSNDIVHTGRHITHKYLENALCEVLQFFHLRN